MYTEHFQLKALPFENVPDPAFFFGKGDYHRVLVRMTDSLTAGRGLLVIAGPIGSGKTTLCQKLKSDLPLTTKVVWLAEPPGSSSNLFLLLAQELGIESPSTERAFVVRDIRSHLLGIQEGGDRCLMIIDEAHLMSDEELEGVRLLNNLEENAAKLVQVIMLGQNELTASINRPELEPFRQRIAGLEILGRMEPEQVREYVLHRLHIAGGKPGIFSEAAIEAVALSSGGVPRMTNSLCNRALRVTYERGQNVVDLEAMHRAAHDLGLGRATFHSLLKHKAIGNPVAVQAIKEGSEEEHAAPAENVTNGKSASPEQAARPGLRGPLLLLLLSVLSFLTSLWIYCGRSGPDNCLESLVRNFL